MFSFSPGPPRAGGSNYQSPAASDVRASVQERAVGDLRRIKASIQQVANDGKIPGSCQITGVCVECFRLSHDAFHAL